MNKPLPIAFILFIAGIIFAHHISIPFLAVIGLIVLFFILPLLLKKLHNLIFYIICGSLVLLLGAACYLNYNKLSPNHIAQLLKDKPGQYYIQGMIVSSPDYFWRRWGKRRCSFLLKARSYKKNRAWVKIDGLSKVDIKDSEREYSYGDTVVIFGKLKRPPSATNPGQFDYAKYLRRKRVYTLIDVKSDGDIISLKRARPLIPKKFIFNIRASVERLIKRYLPGQNAAALNAMLIGRRTGLSKELRESFVKTGTAHILAISGLHVAIISVMVFFILRSIRIPRKTSSTLVIGFLIIYALLTGARPPILRATIMIIIYLLGYVLERDFDIYSALSLAGIIMLLMNPMQLFNAGFVLSFVCVFSICYLTPKLESILTHVLSARDGLSPVKKNLLTRYTLRLILSSLAVYIGVVPVIGHYFNIVSPITVLANLLIVPLLGVVLFFGILFIIAGSLCAPLAVVFSYPLHLILSVLLKIIFFLSNIPFGYFYIPDIPLYAIAIYYILILTVIKRKSLGLDWIRISAIGLLIINIFIWRPLFAKTDQLRVTFLDIAGGDSIFLEFPDGKTMLINAGRRIGNYLNQSQAIVLPFIWSRGRRSIDAVFLTRSEPAHLGAVLSVLEKARARYFISGGLDYKNRMYRKLKDPIASNKIKDIRVKDGMRIEGFDDASLLVITPSQLKVTYKDANFLFFPEKKIFQLGEDEPQVIDTSSCGAITITTDGFHYFSIPPQLSGSE